MKYLSITIIFIWMLMDSEPIMSAVSPWPMFRHDLLHTGRSQYTGPSEPYILWTFKAQDGIASSPSIGGDGTIYFGSGWDFNGSSDPALYALHSDGSLKWRFNTAGGVFSSPAITPDGIIYFGSLDGHLYSVKDTGRDGQLLWRSSLKHWVYSSPAVGYGGDIFIGGLLLTFYAFRPDGTLRWSHPTDWCVFSSPAITPDGIVYVGSKDEHLYAFTETGEFLFAAGTGSFYDGHMVDSSPAVGPDGTIYVGVDPYGAVGQVPYAIDTALFAFRPDGSLKWTFDMDDGAESSPAIGPDGTVYIGSYDGRLYAVADRGDEPELLWSFKTGGWIDGSPAVDADGVIYFGSRDSTLYALDTGGNLLWSLATEGGIESSPAIDGRGVLYFGSFDGVLHAVGKPGPDAGIISVETSDTVQAGAAFAVSARIANHRETPVDVPVRCIIRGGSDTAFEHAAVVTGIDGGSEAAIRFPAWTPVEITAGEYTVEVTTLLDNDTRSSNDSMLVTVPSSDPISVNDSGGGRPEEIVLSGACHPNPFNRSTTFEVHVTAVTGVGSSINVYDISGKLVRRLHRGVLCSGAHTFVWDGRDDDGAVAASGIYIFRISSPGYSGMMKAAFVK